MKNFIFSFALFVSALFYCISAIIGVNYAGIETSSSYVYVCAFSFVSVVSVFVFSYLNRLSSKNLLSIFIVLSFCLIGIVSGFSHDRSFYCMGALCFPACCVGVGFSKEGSLKGIIRWLDIICLILTVSLFYSVIKLRTSIIEGDSYYSQTLSYIAGLTFLMVLSLLQIGTSPDRFPVFNSKIFRILSIVFLAIYPLVILLSGGRGGFVVVSVGVLVSVLISDSNRKWRLLFIFIIVSALFLVLIHFSRSSSFLSVFSSNFARVFSYITEGGIDLSQTSGRDSVYKEAWSLFLMEPPFGYGLFTYKHYLLDQPYPHNLFLEWLLQGGILFLLVWIGLLFVFFKRLRRLFMTSRETAFLLIPLVIYSFVKLMFSGSYLEEPLFWFCLVFVFNYSSVKS